MLLTPTHLGIAMEYAAGGNMYDYVVARARLQVPVCVCVFARVYPAQIRLIWPALNHGSLCCCMRRPAAAATLPGGANAWIPL